MIYTTRIKKVQAVLITTESSCMDELQSIADANNLSVRARIFDLAGGAMMQICTWHGKDTPPPEDVLYYTSTTMYPLGSYAILDGWKFSLMDGSRFELAYQSSDPYNRAVACLEMWEDNVYIPESNCSCHLSAPCSDCVENNFLRELVRDSRIVRKMLES